MSSTRHISNTSKWHIAIISLYSDSVSYILIFRFHIDLPVHVHILEYLDALRIRTQNIHIRLTL